MAANVSVTTAPETEDLVITRVFDAPRALVCKAWTDSKQVAQWWGPSCFTNPVCELDPRPGGAIRIHMRAPDGTVYPMTGVYQEIMEPERIIFNSAALDQAGNALFEVRTTVTLAEDDEKTTQTMRARVMNQNDKAAPFLAGMEAGWMQSLDRLSTFLANA